MKRFTYKNSVPSTSTPVHFRAFTKPLPLWLACAFLILLVPFSAISQPQNARAEKNVVIAVLEPSLAFALAIVEPAASVDMFDARQHERWRLDEQSLPAGSIVQFKEPSRWQLYKWYIVGLATAVFVEAMLIAWLAFLRARRRQAEKEKAHLAQVAEAEGKKLDEVVSNVPGIVWETRIDPDTGERKTTFISDYVEHMLGYTPDEWLASAAGMGMRIMAEDDRAHAQLESDAVIASGREGVTQHRWHAKDGRIVWAESYLNPIIDDSNKVIGLRGVTIDITERKESEAAVIKAHEELRAAHEEVKRLKNQLQEENIYLKEEIKLEQNFEEIVGESAALKRVLLKIQQVAPTDATVLVTGETGTGKELVARAIHDASTRADRPLVKVNCAALSSNLIESELFGHDKGAFTGATTRKIGRFELANGGTIFLDEIGELPLALQVKLLRIIQEGEFERLGNSRTIKVDVRIIAATNRDLKVEVDKGLFREDLWYRLNVFPVTVPPLRQRQEDIPLLVEHFVRRFNKKLGNTITSVTPGTLERLREHSWPGNIRELANVIERAMINSQGSVLRIAEDFDATLLDISPRTPKTLEEVERDYIVNILEETNWRIEGNQGAARILGINPSTLRTRMMKLGIHKRVQSISKSS